MTSNGEEGQMFPNPSCTSYTSFRLRPVASAWPERTESRQRRTSFIRACNVRPKTRAALTSINAVPPRIGGGCDRSRAAFAEVG